MGQDTMKYVRSRSWHVVLTPTRMFHTYRTLCGRTLVTRATSPTLPLGDKSCETCLRMDASRVAMVREDSYVTTRRDATNG